MQNLTRASQELFRRTPDETFPSLAALAEFCRGQREASAQLRSSPKRLWMKVSDSGQLLVADSGRFELPMNDWSFSQVCRLAGVSKRTVNRLSAATAARVLAETIPRIDSPLQLYAIGTQARSIHGSGYTRVFHAELLELVLECADAFQPPPEGLGGGTGLYCGQQDLFCFLIDPNGWTEIGGQAFAPGFFLWNSEVGRRTLGIQTFWYQRICQNHIVWDAVDVVEMSRRHTSGVRKSLDEIRSAVDRLVAQRDARRDGFVRVIRRAMSADLGDVEEVKKLLAKSGFRSALVGQAIELAQQRGRFTLFALVDAVTRLASKMPYAGDRTQVDQQAGRLLTLAA